MAKIADWDERIGRRLRLRDLRVFFHVVELGSFAKAAAQLRVSQPAVSRVIADLEHSLGARLFDRNTRGVEPTPYGRALLLRGRAAFDELRQAIGDIEFLSDPDAGEVRVGSPDVLTSGFIAAIVDRLNRKSPGIIFQTINGNRASLSAALRERRIDVMVSRWQGAATEDDLTSEKLFDEQLFVVAGLRNQWARRRSIELGELLDEQWVLPPPSSATGAVIAAGFYAAGFTPRRPSVASDSIMLRNLLLVSGRYLGVLPGSILQFAREQLRVKILPVHLPPGMVQPTDITWHRNRSLSPVVERFIACARDVAKTVTKAGSGHPPTKN